MTCVLRTARISNVESVMCGDIYHFIYHIYLLFSFIFYSALVRVNTKYAESWTFMADLTLSTVIVNVEYTAFVSSPKQLTTVTSTRACQRERREKTSSLHRALEPVTKRFYNEGLAI